MYFHGFMNGSRFLRLQTDKDGRRKRKLREFRAVENVSFGAILPLPRSWYLQDLHKGPVFPVPRPLPEYSEAV